MRDTKALKKALSHAHRQSDHLSHQVRLLLGLYAFTSCEGLEREIEKAQTMVGNIETACIEARRALGGVQ